MSEPLRECRNHHEACRAHRVDCADEPHCRSCGITFYRATPPVPAGRLMAAVRAVIADGYDAPGVHAELHAAYYEARDAAPPPVPADPDAIEAARLRHAETHDEAEMCGPECAPFLTPPVPAGDERDRLDLTNALYSKGRTHGAHTHEALPDDPCYEYVVGACVLAGVRLTEGGCDLTCGHSGEHWQADPEEEAAALDVEAERVYVTNYIEQRDAALREALVARVGDIVGRQAAIDVVDAAWRAAIAREYEKQRTPEGEG